MGNDNEIKNSLSDLLAAERTQLALERTHLSWIRTVIAMIASGFAIDKLVEALHQDRMLSGKAIIMQTHITGLAMAITGTAVLVIEGIYYMVRFRQLEKIRGNKGKIPLGMILSLLIFCTGGVLVYLILVSDTSK